MNLHDEHVILLTSCYLFYFRLMDPYPFLPHFLLFVFTCLDDMHHMPLFLCSLNAHNIHALYVFYVIPYCFSTCLDDMPPDAPHAFILCSINAHNIHALLFVLYVLSVLYIVSNMNPVIPPRGVRW